MKEYQAAAVLFALFVLRCIAPLVITLVIGYMMNRLVDRWQAEEEAQQQTGIEVQTRPKRVPDITLPPIDIPCWLLRNCDAERRFDCPAYQQQAIPCWLARMKVEGILPASCPACPIYRQAAAPT